MDHDVISVSGCVLLGPVVSRFNIRFLRSLHLENVGLIRNLGPVSYFPIPEYSDSLTVYFQGQREKLHRFHPIYCRLMSIGKNVEHDSRN